MIRSLLPAFLLALSAAAPAQLNHNLILSGTTSVIMWNGQPAIVMLHQRGDVCSFVDPVWPARTPVRLHVQAALILDSRSCAWGGKLDLSCNDYHDPRLGIQMPPGGFLLNTQPRPFPMEYSRACQMGFTTWTWSFCGHTGSTTCSRDHCYPEWNAVVCYVSLG
jgi:hypothetical protein